MIDESEIREALKPWRPDALVFAAGVQNRVELAKKQIDDVSRLAAGSTTDARQNDWLRIAASFAPIHLLGNRADIHITPVSFAAISLGKKLVVAIAFPFVCFLMIGLTIAGMMRIRAAQMGESTVEFDVDQARHATNQWWRRYGWIAVLVFVAALTSPFLGWTTPLMVALVCSGFAAVSLIRSLAKENLVERSVIGGICVAGLGLLGQMSGMLANMNSTQVLDPNLVMGVLFGGAFAIGAFIRHTGSQHLGDAGEPSKRNRIVAVVTWTLGAAVLSYLAYASSSPFMLIILVVAITSVVILRRNASFAVPRLSVVANFSIAVVIMTVCTQSYWRGVTQSDVQKYVNEFNGTQLGMWEDWADYAMWLEATGMGYDKVMVLKHFNKDLDRNPPLRPSMLSAAVRAGLISSSEVVSRSETEADRPRWSDPQFIDEQIFGVTIHYFRMAAIADDVGLTEKEREVLAERLMVNWTQLDSDEFDHAKLKSCLLLTELFERLGSTIQFKRRSSDVHRWLVANQVNDPSPFSTGGGFRITNQVNSSDWRTTVAAISLMDKYGVPADLQIAPLRSYLRPNFLYDFMPYTYVPKKVAREKLVQLPGIAPMTILDYLRSELPLWLAIMLVLLLGYATINSPSRVKQSESAPS